MSKGKIIKVFPGANTSRGFFSLYHYIIPPDTTRIFVIKGGPGVGKSTFMKKITESLVALGYEAEWHCCSSDNGSIDGVVFPSIGIALIDGTAPHIVDPKNPGAVDEIIHLGDYWNEASLRANKEGIISDNKRVGRLFGIAYFALQEAMIAMAEWKSYISEAQNWASVNSQFAVTWDELMGRIQPQYSTSPVDRHLFAWAVSPGGRVNYIDTIVEGLSTLYLLEGEPGSGKSTFINKFGVRALELGLDVEFYHNTLNPDELDGVVIRSEGIALFSASGPFAYQSDNFKGFVRRVNLGESLTERVIITYCTEIKEAKERCLQHLDRAVSYVAKAKATHDHMELFYVPAMDFQAIERKRVEIERRILSYAQEMAIAASRTKRAKI